MLRRLLASPRSTVVLGVSLLILHVIWFESTAHQPDVISGLGVSMEVLGALIAAQPLASRGIDQTARLQAGLHNRPQSLDEKKEEQVLDKTKKHVWQERVVGVGFLAMGTLLNGYANAIGRLLQLKGVP